jgi:putative redox protein
MRTFAWEAPMIEVRFPGGKKVEAAFGGYCVVTDQPASSGGEGTAPSPFDLFLASIATCAGFYALRFCQERNLDTDGLKVSMETERDASRKKIVKLKIAIDLPERFPERYREAILRSVGQCPVKRHLEEPPAMLLTTRIPALEPEFAIA